MTPKPSPSSPLPRCPFCKKQDPVKACESYEVDGRGDAESENFVVICDALHGGCGSCTGSCRTMQEAIDLWGQAARTQGADPGQPAAGLHRAEFEAWMIEEAGESASRRPNMLDRKRNGEEYAFEPAHSRWVVWQAAWKRLAALFAPSQGPAGRWSRSRTDIQSYGGDGKPVVYLYPPDESQERIGIRGPDCQATADRLLAALNAAPTVKDSLTVPPVPAAPAAPVDAGEDRAEVVLEALNDAFEAGRGMHLARPDLMSKAEAWDLYDGKDYWVERLAPNPGSASTGVGA